MSYQQAIPDSVLGTGGTDTQAGALLQISARAPLELWQFSIGYCLDAPSFMPSGASHAPVGQAVPALTRRA